MKEQYLDYMSVLEKQRTPASFTVFGMMTMVAAATIMKFPPI